MPSRTTRRVITAALAVLLAVACGDDAPPPPTGDGGPRRDAGPRPDGAPLDSGPETDAGPTPDAALPDGAVRDGGRRDARVVEPDAGLGCMGGDRCNCPLGGIECGAGGACPAGYVCEDSTCGVDRCLPRGAFCGTDADCPATSACTSVAGGRFCLRATAGCTDSRECTAGFACEGGTCVDRRAPCVVSADCPRGYHCRTGVPGHGNFCEYIGRGCDSTDVCFLLSSCVDAEGDGDLECAPVNGACRTNADCSGGLLCGGAAETHWTSCGNYGFCTGSCPAGGECLDLFGDGNRECVPAGGSCRSTASCPPRQVCASPAAGMAPRCIPGRSS